MSFTPDPVSIRVPHGTTLPSRYQLFGFDLPEGVRAVRITDTPWWGYRQLQWCVSGDSTVHTLEITDDLEADTDKLVQVAYVAIRLTC